MQEYQNTISKSGGFHKSLIEINNNFKMINNDYTSLIRFVKQNMFKYDEKFIRDIIKCCEKGLEISNSNMNVTSLIDKTTSNYVRLYLRLNNDIDTIIAQSMSFNELNIVKINDLEELDSSLINKKKRNYANSRNLEDSIINLIPEDMILPDVLEASANLSIDSSINSNNNVISKKQIELNNIEAKINMSRNMNGIIRILSNPSLTRSQYKAFYPNFKN